MLEVCLGWVKKELSMENLFTFYKMGLFVKSIDCEDVLKSCKEFILTCTADELLDFSKNWSEDENLISNTWSEDDNLIKFMLDKEMLSVTLPTVIVESLSATLWAFLLTVTKVSRYVPYDLLVE